MDVKKLKIWDNLYKKVRIPEQITFEEGNAYVYFYESDGRLERISLKYCKIITDELLCSLDGNCLSVINWNFTNLQESPSVFIELTNKQIKEIEKLSNN